MLTDPSLALSFLTTLRGKLTNTWKFLYNLFTCSNALYNFLHFYSLVFCVVLLLGWLNMLLLVLVSRTWFHKHCWFFSRGFHPKLVNSTPWPTSWLINNTFMVCILLVSLLSYYKVLFFCSGKELVCYWYNQWGWLPGVSWYLWCICYRLSCSQATSSWCQKGKKRKRKRS